MPFLSPRGLFQGLAQHDAGVLHRVVAIHIQVAPGLQLQADARIKAEGGEHMVKEADAGGHLHLPHPG